jgi:hypothetical protein
MLLFFLCVCLLLGFQILNRKRRHVFRALTAPYTESSHHRLQPQPDHIRAGVFVLRRQAEKLGHWRCFGQCCGGRSSPWLRCCSSPWLRRCPSPWLRRCPSPWLRRCPSPWLRCCSRLECCSQSLKTHAPLHSKTFVLPSSVTCSESLDSSLTKLTNFTKIFAPKTQHTHTGAFCFLKSLLYSSSIY